MNITNRYNFKEAALGTSFAFEKFAQVEDLINRSISFTTLAIPGIGVSYFLRYLATTNIAYFVFVDMFSLASLSKQEFFKLLLNELGGKTKSDDPQEILNLCRETLTKLCEKQPKVVIIFNRFDEMKDEFDKPFFANLRLLREGIRDKVVMIFTSNKPLYELAPQAISGPNLDFYSQVLYIQPYSNEDQKKIINLVPTESKIPSKDLNKLLALCGGHNQCLQILLKSEVVGTPLLDRYVKLQLKEIFEFLNHKQKLLIQKIAAGKSISEVEPYLLNIGMVVKQEKGFKLFSPLFSEFVLSQTKMKLPYKEAKLFNLLKKNLDNIVSKDEIFRLIWAENPDDGSDWALDALIYRLRKNQSFINSGFIIESHKKLGYKLIKA
jgi:hypothetical protein